MAKIIEYQFKKEVKQTKNQIKKHYTQFSELEKMLLKLHIDSIPKNEIKIIKHAKNHMDFLNNSIINQVLEKYEIIEFNVNFKPERTDCRVLIRSVKTLNIKENGTVNKANVCIVLDVRTGEVITAYANYKDDNHSNINMNRYDESINIIKYATM